MEKRRCRTKQILSLEERLLKAAEDLRARARELEPGEGTRSLLAKVSQFEAQASINEFIRAAAKHRAKFN
jgi:hypothetical protein